MSSRRAKQQVRKKKKKVRGRRSLGIGHSGEPLRSSAPLLDDQVLTFRE